MKPTSVKVKISPAAAKFVKRDAPKQSRLMAAKGTIPLVPRDLVGVLFFLLSDPDQEVQETAQETFRNLPDQILDTILSEKIHPRIINHLAQVSLGNELRLQKIILNRTTDDQTMLMLAEKLLNGKLLEIIANNQERILRHPPLAKALGKNPALDPVAKDRLAEFCKMFDNLREEALSAERTIPDREVEEEEENRPVDLPENLLVEETEEEEEKEEEEKGVKSLFQQILDMSVTEKVHIALLGNKEARGILARDRNRVIARSVLRSPKITDSEILTLSKSRDVDDDILRTICSNREWLKHYQIKLELVNNPKTPLNSSIRLLSTLREKDIEKLIKNRNIPSALSSTARRLVESKKKH